MKESKYSYERLLKILNERQMRIISGEYVNCNSKFLIESKEGYRSYTNLSGIVGAKDIRYFSATNEFALYNISKWIENNGYNFALKSKVYNNSKEELEFECHTHGRFYKTFKQIKLRPFCHLCSKVRRYTIEEIHAKANSLGLTWIDGEYTYAHENIVVSDKDGYKSQIRVIQIMQGHKPKMFCKHSDYVLDNIKLWLSKNKNHLVLLSDKYIGSKSPLRIKCTRHNHEFDITWEKLKGSSNCPKCNGSYIYSLNEIREMLPEVNKDIEILYEYKNEQNQRMIMCKCSVDGHEWGSSFSDLISGGHGCRFCSYRNKSGTNNYNYNHEKTPEEREIRREYTEYYSWRKSVYDRDGYTCIISGDNRGGNLVAHHLYSYFQYKDLRTNISNGVTLTEEVHKEFHTIYGYRNNTIEQFKEFYKNKTGKEFLQEVVLS